MCDLLTMGGPQPVKPPPKPSPVMLAPLAGAVAALVALATLRFTNPAM